jgi:hypothetical protein
LTVRYFAHQHQSPFAVENSVRACLFRPAITGKRREKEKCSKKMFIHGKRNTRNGGKQQMGARNRLRSESGAKDRVVEENDSRSFSQQAQLGWPRPTNAIGARARVTRGVELL